MRKYIGIMRRLKGVWIKVGIFLAIIGTIWQVSHGYQLIYNGKIHEEIINSIIGIVLTAVITILIMRTQFGSEHKRETEAKVFEERLKIYNEFIDTIERLFEDNVIEDVGDLSEINKLLKKNQTKSQKRNELKMFFEENQIKYETETDAPRDEIKELLFAIERLRMHTDAGVLIAILTHVKEMILGVNTFHKEITQQKDLSETKRQFYNKYSGHLKGIVIVLQKELYGKSLDVLNKGKDSDGKTQEKNLEKLINELVDCSGSNALDNAVLDGEADIDIDEKTGSSNTGIGNYEELYKNKLGGQLLKVVKDLDKSIFLKIDKKSGLYSKDRFIYKSDEKGQQKKVYAFLLFRKGYIRVYLRKNQDDDVRGDLMLHRSNDFYFFEIDSVDQYNQFKEKIGMIRFKDKTNFKNYTLEKLVEAAYKELNQTSK